jgi:hypothetical protein
MLAGPRGWSLPSLSTPIIMPQNFQPDQKTGRRRRNIHNDQPSAKAAKLPGDVSGKLQKSSGRFQAPSCEGITSARSAPRFTPGAPGVPPHALEVRRAPARARPRTSDRTLGARGEDGRALGQAVAGRSLHHPPARYRRSGADSVPPPSRAREVEAELARAAYRFCKPIFRRPSIGRMHLMVLRFGLVMSSANYSLLP